MSRKRLRPDYIVRNYTYHCLIRGTPPQALWETAKHMQVLWNGLVAFHDALLDALPRREECLGADGTKTYGKRTEVEKAFVKKAYETFWAEAYAHVKEHGDRLGLSAWQKWHVYDAFKVAQRRFASGKGGTPRAHHGLREVIIPHRTDSGGVPVAWLFRDSDQKHTCVLPPEAGHHHQPAYTTIGGVRIPLLVLLHRPLPEHAILKRVALLGSFEPSLRSPTDSGWAWKLQCTIEMPRPLPAPPTRASIGIDVGWRVREEGLRVAVLSDGQRHYELLLPWDMANKSLRRRQGLYLRHDAELQSTGSWRRLWEWQGEIDTALELCKKALVEADKRAWPAEASVLWSGHVQMRAAGLRRLAALLAHTVQELESLGDELPTEKGRAYMADARATLLPTLTILAAWDETHRLAMRRFRGAQLRMMRSRNALYRAFAHWIATHYDTVCMEGDLNLKQLAEQETTGQYALAASQRYRQMAGVSVLRRYIREALETKGRMLVPYPAAFTSRTCTRCNAPIQRSAALVGVCAHGHERDQDVTAAVNLYTGIPVDHRRRGREAPVATGMFIGKIRRIVEE